MHIIIINIVIGLFIGMFDIDESGLVPFDIPAIPKQYDSVKVEVNYLIMIVLYLINLYNIYLLYFIDKFDLIL